MKKELIGFLAVSLLLVPVAGVFASGEVREHLVQPGENLWQIAGDELGSPWCWTLIAAIPENDLDYQGYLYAGDSITLPPVESCTALANPLSVSGSQVDEEVLEHVLIHPWYATGSKAETYIEKTYRDAVNLVGYSKADDMYHRNDPDLYRERDGDTWYVNSRGERSQAWDYVDHVLKNDQTGSVFYRARDIQGRWYLVSNEESTLLSFEPNYVYLNTITDEAFVYRGDDDSTQFYSSTESWVVSQRLYVVAAASDGRILFQNKNNIALRTIDDNGEIVDMCDSAACSSEITYWLSGEKIATVSSTMVPLFSQSDAAVKLPFYFVGAQKAFKYYGAFGRPWFDADGNLVFTTIFDNRISKQTFDLK
ncbi:MAG: hypothetical protein HQ488_05130 [Parcubacteria group bacterium]|nr:hypothetical protein [Parcubacteria group bacterium]